MISDKAFLMYKGRPFVRKNNICYYGYMYDDVVAMLNIESSFNFRGLDVSDRIELKLVLTDPEVELQDVIVKQSLRSGLFDALDIANIWIERFIRKKI